jgi:hypothetical protein
MSYRVSRLHLDWTGLNEVTLTVIINPVIWPNARPLLPRSSSSESGFFFCGMRDDPKHIKSAI